jgi:hypothetical protein
MTTAEKLQAAYDALPSERHATLCRTCGEDINGGVAKKFYEDHEFHSIVPTWSHIHCGQERVDAAKAAFEIQTMDVEQTGQAGPPAVTALETEYAGVMFRSRIEARWAVFLDEFGIIWEYEKEGLNLGGTWYLPDFWLPQLGVWMEIKGAAPNKEELEKAALLAAGTGSDVFIFHGDIPRGVDWYYHEQSPGAIRFEGSSGGLDSERFFFSLCRRCLTCGIVPAGKTSELCGCATGHYTTLDERRIEGAYDKARSERFGT